MPSREDDGREFAVKLVAELDAKVEQLELQIRELVEILVKRRAMEPKHREEMHECDECTVLAEMGRNREGFVVKRD